MQDPQKHRRRRYGCGRRAIAGIQASLDLAESGYYVYLVERKPRHRRCYGAVWTRRFQLMTAPCASYRPNWLRPDGIFNIELITLGEVQDISGEAGNFQVKLLQKPRYIDLSKCTSCGECAKVCPIEVENEFDEGIEE